MIVHVLHCTPQWLDDCKSFACYFTTFFCWSVIAKTSFLLLPKEYVFLKNAIIVGMHMVIPGVSVS